jgi:signal peptidase I
MSSKQTSFVLTYAVQSFGLILLFAILIRIFLLSSYVMSGSAMLPSIWPGDFLVGTKWHMSSVPRGTIVILRCPQTREHLCLKRVVAVAGDRVEFKDGHLWINGGAATYRSLGASFGQETVEGTSWAVWPSAGAGVSKSPLVVPPQSVYLLNDKRDDGEDSRSWGPIANELLEARAARIWLSLDWYDRDGHLRSWPRVRWGRLFRSIN